MESPVILCATRSFLVCCKPIGCECEHELPALLASVLNCKVESLYCVHRLDRAVGGVMVWARTPKAAAALSRQIQECALEKEYLAVCAGVPAPSVGEMRDHLYKDAARQKAYAVKSARRGTKEASLAYTVLDDTAINGAGASLVRVTLHTGRFHQIRCQFAARQHPLLGDGKYGSREKGCPVALWSHRIAFYHPDSGARVEFSASPPAVFPWDQFSIPQ